MCVCVCVCVNSPECLHVGGWVCGLPRWPSGKESACNAVDPGSIPGPGRPSGGGHGSPLQCSCLEKPLERGTWRARVYRVTQSRTRLRGLSIQHVWVCACVCVCACVNLRMRVVVFLVVHRCAHMWRERKEEIHFV